MISRLLLFFRLVRDRIPLYSYRDCCRHWLQGRDHGMRERGIARDERGRFTRISSQ